MTAAYESGRNIRHIIGGAASAGGKIPVTKRMRIERGRGSKRRVSGVGATTDWARQYWQTICES